MHFHWFLLCVVTDAPVHIHNFTLTCLKIKLRKKVKKEICCLTQIFLIVSFLLTCEILLFVLVYIIFIFYRSIQIVSFFFLSIMILVFLTFFFGKRNLCFPLCLAYLLNDKVYHVNDTKLYQAVSINLKYFTSNIELSGYHLMHVHLFKLSELSVDV